MDIKLIEETLFRNGTFIYIAQLGVLDWMLVQDLIRFMAVIA